MIGVAIVDTIVNRDLGWIFRRQDQAGTDHGIDAQIEVVEDDGRVTGRLLAVQIKSGPSYFRHRRGDAFAANVSEQHLKYWLHHSLAVLFVLVDTEREIAYWHLVQEPVECGSTGATLYVPTSNQLSPDAKAELRSFTQTPAELRAELVAERRHAAQLAELLAAPREAPSVAPHTPSRALKLPEITEHALFWSSLEELPSTEEVSSTVSGLIAAVVRAPFAPPVVTHGVRTIKVRPYLGRPGLRLAYVVGDDEQIVLLSVDPYEPNETDIAGQQEDLLARAPTKKN
jgi:hypothetical protein